MDVSLTLQTYCGYIENVHVWFYLHFYGNFALKRCIRDVHCPAIGAAQGHYLRLTDTIFYFFLFFFFFFFFLGGGGGGG